VIRATKGKNYDKNCLCDRGQRPHCNYKDFPVAATAVAVTMEERTASL